MRTLLKHCASLENILDLKWKICLFCHGVSLLLWKENWNCSPLGCLGIESSTRSTLPNSSHPDFSSSLCVCVCACVLQNNQRNNYSAIFQRRMFICHFYRMEVHNDFMTHTNFNLSCSFMKSNKCPAHSDMHTCRSDERLETRHVKYILVLPWCLGESEITWKSISFAIAFSLLFSSAAFKPLMHMLERKFRGHCSEMERIVVVFRNRWHCKGQPARHMRTLHVPVRWTALRTTLYNLTCHHVRQEEQRTIASYMTPMTNNKGTYRCSFSLQ